MVGAIGKPANNPEGALMATSVGFIRSRARGSERGANAVRGAIGVMFASLLLGCSGMTVQRFYAAEKPVAPPGISARVYDTGVELDVGGAKVFANSVLISERLILAFGPGVIVPVFGKNAYEPGPLAVSVQLYVRSEAVVAFDPRQATIRLRDGRELAPDTVASPAGFADSSVFARLPAGLTRFRLAYAAPRTAGPFTLSLPVITVDGRAVQLPPVVFRIKTRDHSS